MNAACALQHFCDIHGPQILLCTEGRSYIHNVIDNDNEDLKVFYSQYNKTENLQEKTPCKSCSLSSDNILVSSVDLLNNMLYISSSSTPNQELFKNIRNACVRSLNIEKSTENDQPIFFGDDENGYCLSLRFSCKDFHARGSQRLYSLCYLCSDKYHLISLMKYISECMRQAVYWIQYDSNETYEQEGHIKMNTTINGTTTSILRTPPRNPLQRMLSDITHDPNLIYRIHGLFVWILRSINSAINEAIFDALPTEEQTTKQERKDISDNENLGKGRSGTMIESILNPLSILNDSYNYSEHGFDEEDDDYDSLEYQFSSYGYDALQLFRQFIQKLNNIKHLQYILYNWVVGNQLIIKYRNKTDNKDFIRAFASVFRLFLPDGCCHLMETTNQIASCTANLILFDTDLIISTNNFQENYDNNSVIIYILLDNIDEHIREAKLESELTYKSDITVPAYVKTIIDTLYDNSLDDEAFEAIITQHKIKYLNKAKLYFQLGRCQIASTLSLSERQQMKMLKVQNPNDLLLIRFWQKGLSQLYKTQIRMLKQDHNQQQKTKTGGMK